MAKTTLFYYAQTDDSNDGTFLTMGAAFHSIVGSSTEAQMQAVIGAAGTLSDLWVRVAAGGSSSAVTVRNGAADTSITVVPTGAGEFTDNTNTDAVSANDKINFGITVAALTPEFFSCVFDATSDTVFILNVVDNNGDAIAGTDFQYMNQTLGPSNSALANTHLLRSAGTITRTYIFVSSNTTSGNGSASVAVNGTATAQSAVITAATTGLFEDTGSAVSYSAADTVETELIEGSGGATVYTTCGATFISTNSKQDCIGVVAGTRTASATVHFWPISGREVDDNTDEERIKHSMQYDGTASNLRIHALSNSYTGNATFTLRKNGVDTAVTLSHTAASTSLIEDTVNTVTFVAGDDLSLSYTGGTSGTLGANTTWALTLEADAGAATFPITIASSGVGTAVLARLKTVGKTIAASGVGTANFVKKTFVTITASGIGTAAFTVARAITIAATGVGTAILSRVARFPKTIAASGVGTAALSRLKTVAKTIAAAGVGTASVGRGKIVALTIAASGVGTAVVGRLKTVALTIATSGVGTAVLGRVARFPKTIAASGVGTAAFKVARGITIAASGIGTAALSRLKTVKKTIAASGIGTASVSRLKTVLITIAATAIGSASVIVVRCFEYVATLITNLVHLLMDVTTETIYVKNTITDTETVSTTIDGSDIVVLGDMREQTIYIKTEICP